MTVVDAFRAERQALLDIGGALSAGDWELPSGCEGWSVRDVVSHLGGLCWMVVDPSQLPDVEGLSTERAQDVIVGARRSWSSERVLEDYETVSARASQSFDALAAEDTLLALGDLGTYPAAMVPRAYVFDHFTHLRFDLFAPRGPLMGEEPPSDALRLGPTLDWIEAAIGQQNASVLAGLPGAVDLVVTGPAARTISVGEGNAVAAIESDGRTLVRWLTGRARRDTLPVRTSGDLVALRALHQMKVF